MSALAAGPGTHDLEMAFLSAATRDLPGLASALDPRVISEQIAEGFLGRSRDRYATTLGKPGYVSYLPSDSCTLRYDLEAIDNSSGRITNALVTASAFPDRSSATRYYHQLMPLARRVQGRGDVRTFERCAARLEGLDVTIALFPVDGDLPTLVDATDPEVMRSILAETLQSSLRERRGLLSCRVERGHYGRRHRCVLRYEIDLGHRGASDQEHLVLYGKVAGDQRGAVGSAAMTALRGRLTNRSPDGALRIPRSMGYHRGLRLTLLEPIPGEPLMGALIKARARGQANSELAGVSLEDALLAGATVAAKLHQSDIQHGPRRSLDADVARLAGDLDALERAAPELASRLRIVLWDVQARARSSKSLATTLCHGDLSPTQLLFDATACALVDFDTICQAESALDVGHFLANLRLAAVKAPGTASDNEVLANKLGQVFFDAYATLTCPSGQDKELLRARTRAYEMLSLVRLAIHSWQKLKMARLLHVMDLLEKEPW